MLKKLLKYDFKSGLRIFGFVWIVIAAVTGAVTLIFSLMENDSATKLIAGTITIMPIVFAMIGAVTFPYIFAAVRFYKGLLGREGYLMFTLPSSPWKLMTSKLISSVVFAVVTIVLAFFGVGMIFVSVFGEFGGVFFGSFDFGDLFGMSDWDGVLVLVNYLLALVSGILQIYVALCIGHLFRSKRVLWAVLIYFGINFATSMISLFIEIAFISNGDMLSAANSMLYTSIPLYLGLGILYFFISERILRTRLNLE